MENWHSDMVKYVKNRKFSSKNARTYFRQIVKAYDYILNVLQLELDPRP